MEQQFIQYMIEQMKKTIDVANPESSALKFYKSMLNNYQADIMAARGEGLGLQKVILDQIYPQHQRTPPSRSQVVKHYTKGASNE